MKIKNKALASILLAGSMMLTGYSCNRTNNKTEITEPVVSMDIVNQENDIDYELVYKDDITNINDGVEINTQEEEKVEDKVIDIYNFGYLLNDTSVYDNLMNEIGLIETYQKVLITGDAGQFYMVEYALNENEVINGYVFKTSVEVLPNTFIEVDISDQTINMYQDGEKVLSSLVVTGMKDKTPTRLGYHEIYYKERNTTLKDYNDDGSLKYESYVDYWMPFDGGIGLHDAEYHYDNDGSSHGWRSNSEFGGQTYTYNGSHGCVNLDNKTAQYIYDNTEVGTKVLVHK